MVHTCHLLAVSGRFVCPRLGGTGQKKRKGQRTGCLRPWIILDRQSTLALGLPGAFVPCVHLGGGGFRVATACARLAGSFVGFAAHLRFQLAAGAL